MTSTETEIRRQRVRFAAGAFLLALLLTGPLAAVGYRRAADAARFETAEWANERLTEGLVLLRTGEGVEPGNTWLVNVVDGWESPLGEVWTSPPLQSLAQSALNGERTREYDFDGRWLAAGVEAGPSEALVTVVERDDQARDVANARLLWSAIAVAVAGLAAFVTWFATGRAQAPIAKAHNVNRDFIADAAHELRTPLSVIQASAGHALARDRSSDEYRESLGEILSATERAGDSVGELLEFARLEAGQAAPRMAPLRLDLLVEEVASSVRVEHTTVEVTPSSPVVVDADYNLLRQVLANIVGNAAARADAVTLSTHVARDSARVDIADDGPGFSPEVIDQVFERFKRGDQSGSAGLGMAIARSIVDLHGGDCTAVNQPNGGALVSVSLPYEATN